MIDPGRLTPREWAESEARREESRSRLDNPHGRELGRTPRRILAVVFVALMVAVVVLTVLGLLRIIDIPGLSSPPRR